MASIFSPLGRISSNKSQMVNCCHSGLDWRRMGFSMGMMGPGLAREVATGLAPAGHYSKHAVVAHLWHTQTHNSKQESRQSL